MAWGWWIAGVLLNPVVGLVTRETLGRARGRARAWAWLILTLLTASLPAFFPRSERPLPFLASIATIICLLKQYDIFRSPEILRPRSLLAFLVDFANGFWLVRSHPPAGAARSADFVRLRRDLLLAGVLSGVNFLVFQVDWRSHSVLLEHVVKTPLVVLMIAAGVNAGSAAWRLAGGQATLPMGWIATAVTPAEFWKRWNVPTQVFLLHYVFFPARGLRHPLRGTMLTFLVSGLLHEYVIAIAGAPIQGMQVLFFLIHGIGVAATRRVPIAPRWRFAAMGLTLVFNIASAALFFGSLNHVIPFYAER